MENARKMNNEIGGIILDVSCVIFAAFVSLFSIDTTGLIESTGLPQIVNNINVTIPTAQTGFVDVTHQIFDLALKFLGIISASIPIYRFFKGKKNK